MIGATALAATVALGVYVVRKGRVKTTISEDPVPNGVKPRSKVTETPQTQKVETVLPNK